MKTREMSIGEEQGILKLMKDVEYIKAIKQACGNIWNMLKKKKKNNGEQQQLMAETF